MIPLKIQTKESASDDGLKHNILANLSLMDKWVDGRWEAHNRHAILVSFGASFRKDPAGAVQAALDECAARGVEADIFCVKHALPLFADLEIKPKYCVILDPREVGGISTLGYKRADLFEGNIYPETKFLVASMTHPSVTTTLIEGSAQVVGWHSACAAMNDPLVNQHVRNWVTGGSCSAMRAVSLARLFGYRHVHLVGYDAAINEPEKFTEIKKGKLEAMYRAFGLETLSDENPELYATINEKIIPAIEFYAAKKISALVPKDPNSTGHINMLDRFDGGGEKNLAFKLAIGNNIVWCTPELAAMAQDVDMLFSTNTDLTFYMRSGGVTEALWNVIGGSAVINPKILLDF